MPTYHLRRDESDCSHGVIICRVHAYEGLKEANQDNNQEGKEDQRLFHHDLCDCQQSVRGASDQNLHTLSTTSMAPKKRKPSR
jgi:hypothetical protein